MKTALVSHCWLENPLPGYMDDRARCRRLERFLHHYGGDTWPTIILENGSSPQLCDFTVGLYDVGMLNLQPHLKRGYPIGGDNHLYPAVWRNYWQIKNILRQFERVFFIATDAYIVSQRLMDYLDSIESGWVTLWSKEYQCPASEIQVITRGCKAFEDFFAGPCDVEKYNGLWEEMTLPFSHVEKGFVGDRYGEFVPVPPFIAYEPGVHDYYTQTPDSLEFNDAQFPVVRRVNGKVVVA